MLGYSLLNDFSLCFTDVHLLCCAVRGDTKRKVSVLFEELDVAQWSVMIAMCSTAFGDAIQRCLAYYHC